MLHFVCEGRQDTRKQPGQEQTSRKSVEITISNLENTGGEHDDPEIQDEEVLRT